MAAFTKHKKWITYGLGILVAGVWGVVLQRIFAATEPLARPASVKSTGAVNGKAELPVLQPDTFRLLLNYKDPFADNTGSGAAHEAEAALPQVVAAAPMPAVVGASTLEQVVYLGYILNPQTKKRVAILQAEGREHMVQEGEAVNQMKLLRVGTDEIRMSYKGRTKQIKRKL